MNALEEFAFWLPDELIYAALKGGKQAGYSKRIERARRGTDDRSMYTFLGTEWHQAQLLTARDVHHSESHEKTAQLQFAKFAAGLFDKHATALWLKSGHPAYANHYRFIANQAARDVLLAKPWRQPANTFDATEELTKPFADSVFGTGILDLQSSFVTAVDTTENPEKHAELLDEVSETAMRLGGLATLCYLSYAETYLNQDQLGLAPSVLEKN